MTETDKELNCPYVPEFQCIQQWLCNECRFSPTQPIGMMLETIQLKKVCLAADKFLSEASK